MKKILDPSQFFFYIGYFIQHCFICRPSDSLVSVDAGIEPRTVCEFPNFGNTSDCDNVFVGGSGMAHGVWAG
jgi:hypothetical protein